jgi:hypothetical protein
VLPILINGLKRSGKDFLATNLQNVYGGQIVHFADPLKQIVATTLSLKIEELDKLKNEECDIKAGNLVISDFRTLLQKFGTEAMKPLFGDDVWVNLLMQQLATIDDDVVIIPDWRFQREYEVISEVYDVVTVRVVDDNLIADTHISERDLDGFDFDIVINNTHKSGQIDLKPFEVYLGIG